MFVIHDSIFVFLFKQWASDFESPPIRAPIKCYGWAWFNQLHLWYKYYSIFHFNIEDNLDFYCYSSPCVSTKACFFCGFLVFRSQNPSSPNLDFYCYSSLCVSTKACFAVGFSVFHTQNPSSPNFYITPIKAYSSAPFSCKARHLLSN